MDHVTIEVQNDYECGRRSFYAYTIPGPSAGESVEDWFQDSDDVFACTGDGHSCGARDEGHIYEVTIIEAPDQPELVGKSREMGG